VILIDCMAAMPAAGAMRASAVITKAEKAKKSPAINARTENGEEGQGEEQAVDHDVLRLDMSNPHIC